MNAKQLFEKCGAILTENHFVYTSGKHGANYVNKDAVYPHTEIISALCKQMAEDCPWPQVDVVAGPTMGAVILSTWVAHFLSLRQKSPVLSVYAEEDEAKNRVFRRGYDTLIKGKRVLVVEDILTTGGSVRKVVEAAQKLGGTVVGVYGLCNRGNVGEEAVGGVPLKSLVSVSFEMWDAADCPLCKQGVPVNTMVGKGREFLKSS